MADQARTSAALVLGGLLLLPAHPWWAAAPDPCAQPTSKPGAAGWGGSPRVDCAGPGGLEGPARLLFGEGLDANRASAATLEVLPGVGPVRAAAIVRERRRAPLCGPRDLERVPGIGPRTAGRIAPLLRFDGVRGCVLPPPGGRGQAGTSPGAPPAGWPRVDPTPAEVTRGS